MKYANIFTFALLFFCGFEQTQAFTDGYMNSQNIIMSLSQKFEGISLKYDHYGNPCQSVETDDQNSSRDVLGDINLLTGEHLISAPSPSFINWINTCTTSYFQTLSYSYNENLGQGEKDPVAIANGKVWEEKLFPIAFQKILPALDQVLAKNPHIKDRTQMYFSVSYYEKGFVKDQSANLVASLVEWVLGSDEEILSYGKIQNVDQFRSDLARSIENEESLDKATEKVLKILFKRDEFLMY